MRKMVIIPLIVLNFLNVHALPSVLRNGSSLVKDVPESTTEASTSKISCPVGQPWQVQSTLVLCGQCKPLGDCPQTHFCKLDVPSQPGYCCSRGVSGSGIEGAVWQNSPASSSVAEFSSNANESLNFLRSVISQLESESVNETDVIDDDDTSTTQPLVNAAPQFEIPENQKPVLAFITEAPPELVYPTGNPHNHALNGAISDNPISIHWPTRPTEAVSIIPAKSVVKEKFQQIVQASAQQFDRPLIISNTLSPDSFSFRPNTQSTHPEENWKDGGKFVPTSGHFHACTKHSDCFQFREPREWCSVGRIESLKWTERSCFCSTNSTAPACVIQRRNQNVLEWTFCVSYRSLGC